MKQFDLTNFRYCIKNTKLIGNFGKISMYLISYLEKMIFHIYLKNLNWAP